MTIQHVNIADLSVDLVGRRVMRDGAVLDLRGLTFDLFAALIARAGQTATLQDLVDEVWNGDAITNEVITQRVRLLRRALGDDPAQPRYIETVRQKGYRLCAEVADAPATASASWWSSRSVAIGALAVAVVAVALITLRQGPAQSDPLLDRARAYAATGQADDNLRAIDLFEQKLAAAPGDYGAALGLSFAYAQRVCRHDRDPEFAARARALADGILADRPDDAEAISARAYALDCTGDIDGALSGYLRAYSLDASQLDALASAAHLLQVQGKLAVALEHNLFVERAEVGRPSRYIDIQIARCLELMTFYDAAEARYARTVRLYPDNLFAAVANVRFLLSRGRYEQAQAAAERSVRLGAGSADLRRLQGELALLLQQPGAAVERLREAAAATQTNLWPETTLALFAPESSSPARLETIVEIYRSALASGNVWPDESLQFAAILAHQGDPVGATAALREATRLGYRDVAYLERSPLFAKLRELPAFAKELRNMREAANAERDAALAASWWSALLIDPDAL